MHARGLGLTVASALDTAVGMNAGLAAAALVGERAAGLATQEFFLEDVAEPRVIQNGRMSTVLVAPEPDRLAALAASSGRRDWWLERVRRVWERG